MNTRPRVAFRPPRRRRATKLSALACGTCIVLVGVQAGCTGHSVKFVPYVKYRIPSSTHAVAVSGNMEEARACFEKAQLPHNSPRQRYELALQGLDKLTEQLGSPDYALIGEVFGGGNAWASQESLTQALCDKAARNGGDVVMVLRRETIEQPYVYATPGYSTTNSSASAYAYGNSATAYGTSHTTYTPGQTYSGTLYKPQANGLVFKHFPGVGADRQKLLHADDESLARAIPALEALANSKISWDEARERWGEMVDDASRPNGNGTDAAHPVQQP